MQRGHDTSCWQLRSISSYAKTITSNRATNICQVTLVTFSPSSDISPSGKKIRKLRLLANPRNVKHFLFTGRNSDSDLCTCSTNHDHWHPLWIFKNLFHLIFVLLDIIARKLQIRTHIFSGQFVQSVFILRCVCSKIPLNTLFMTLAYFFFI